MSVEDRARSAGFSCSQDTSSGCFSAKFSLRSSCAPNPAIRLVESHCVNMQSYSPWVVSGSQGSSAQTQSVYSPCLWWALSGKVLTVASLTWFMKVLGTNMAANCPETSRWSTLEGKMEILFSYRRNGKLRCIIEKVNPDSLILEFDIEDAWEIPAMMLEPWLPSVAPDKPLMSGFIQKACLEGTLGSYLALLTFDLFYPWIVFHWLQPAKKSSHFLNHSFSWVIRKEKKPRILQTYKGICGEETRMILSVCSNTMLALGLGGEVSFSQVFSELFALIVFTIKCTCWTAKIWPS